MQGIERSTLTFYEENAVRYALQTGQVDLTHLYARFLPLLPLAGRILDLGCGGGRDLRAFRASGFDCIGMDPSPHLAQIAAEFSSCEVVVSRAQDLSVVDEFDGIWACASLLHIARSELPFTLVQVRNALKAGGVLFLSMQEGRGSAVAVDGRFYEWYSAPELAAMTLAAGLEVICHWSTPDALLRRESVSWINLLAGKPKA